MMIWLYRLQQRVAVSRDECVAIATLLLLLLGGLAARHLQAGLVPVSEVDYAAGDRLFREGTRAGAAEAGPAEAAAGTLEERRSAADGPPDGPPDPVPSAAQAPTGLLDLNTASAAALERLPRIGPKLAARIVAYREAHGPFPDVDALVQVRGIGKKTLTRLRSRLYVHPESASNGGP